jgi:hypothetical protein
MNKRERTRNFVSENITDENKDCTGLEMYQQLDDEIRQELDYHAFRTYWKVYREELNGDEIS